MGRQRIQGVARVWWVLTVAAVIFSTGSTVLAAAATPGTKVKRSTQLAAVQPGVVTLPGHLNAVDYRAGGQGVGFHDTDLRNRGSAYRADAVDIQVSQGREVRYNVGWIEAGEWLTYDVEVDKSAIYTFVVRLATSQNCTTQQRFHIELDGTNVTGPIPVPNTGGWQAWADVNTRPVSISRGTYTLKVVADTAGFNLTSIEVREAVPEFESEILLPGRIEAEDYRLGGEGIGYHDTEPVNHCGAYRADDVDIQICDDGDGPCHNVGWMRENEWLAYTVTFPASGTYLLTARTATILNDRSFHVEFDGTDVTGSVSVPNTGGWHKWTDIELGLVTVAAGSYTMKVVADTGRFNLNYVDVSLAPSALGSLGELSTMERWQ